jgi:hypothetical protein
MEYFEQLAREWYEYQGYFVRRDLWVGLEANGTYECELCIVAFHPTRHHLLHIEPSFDLLSWDEKEQHFRTKFDAGRKYLHRMFGIEPRLHIEQRALIVSSEEAHSQSIAGGRIVLISDLIAEILGHLAGLDMASAPVDEQWPLIRTLQLVSQYRARLSPLLKST